MKQTLSTLTAAAALTLGGAASAQAATTCYSIDVPAIPAVYETVTTPAVTVTEYEFIHAQDGNGQGNGQGPAETKWTEDANWNAQGNAHSIGWTATGNTRIRVIETERTTVTLVAPAVPATVREECVELPDGIPPIAVGAPEVPLGNLDPAPAVTPVEAPAPVAAIVEPATAQAAPLANVGAVQAAPVADAQPVEELALTGAADWVLPAGLALVLVGAAAVASRRFIATK